jgi:glycosyltransferase involved in cell wall biosynthesis
MVHIGNGIDVERYLEAPFPPLGADKPVVLMISRLVADKGVRDFFAVATALSDVARFVHVGPIEIDQRDAIPEAEMKAVEAQGHVEFVGRVADVRPHIARSHLVLLPSFREGIPRAAMEAAAMGRPVAGYDIRGLREVVPPGLDLLVRRSDVPALTRLVSALVREPERLTSLGRACRESVVTQFSEDIVVERVRKVYAGYGAA